MWTWIRIRLSSCSPTTVPADNVRSLGFGAGMGLPNMKKYSDEMTIDSVVGQGTTLKMVVYAQSEKS